MAQKKAFIWDLDGTLLDSYRIIVDSLYELSKEYQMGDTRDAIHKCVIQTSCSTYIGQMRDKSGKPYEEVKEAYSKISGPKKADIELIPYAKEVLMKLKEQGAEHFVFTHRGKTTVPVLQNLGIYDCFTEILTSESGFQRKPDPEALLYLMKKYGLEATDTYYVGDRTIDMDCARNAGVKGILYLPEDSFCEANGSETYQVQSLLEIENIFYEEM